jgi:PTH1 family peptidyl-tRNA hydrolase
VGLGNPGPEYQATRHNVGFWLVEQVAAEQGAQFRHEGKWLGMACRVVLGGEEVRLFKPMTFMNRSGRAVSSICHYFEVAPEALVVVHDELDLPPGQARLKWGGGHAGHNGLRDIISALGTGDFWRLRIGIGHPGERDRVVDYVLSRPARAEEEAIREALAAVTGVVPELVGGAYQKAMNRLHGGR